MCTSPCPRCPSRCPLLAQTVPSARKWADESRRTRTSQTLRGRSVRRGSTAPSLEGAGRAFLLSPGILLLWTLVDFRESPFFRWKEVASDEWLVASWALVFARLRSPCVAVHRCPSTELRY